MSESTEKLGKIVKQGDFKYTRGKRHMRCKRGVLTLYERGFQAQCLEERQYTLSQGIKGFWMFGIEMYHRKPLFYINNDHYEVKDPDEWVKTIMQLMDKEDIKFEQTAIGYRPQFDRGYREGG